MEEKDAASVMQREKVWFKFSFMDFRVCKSVCNKYEPPVELEARN